MAPRKRRSRAQPAAGNTAEERRGPPEYLYPAENELLSGLDLETLTTSGLHSEIGALRMVVHKVIALSQQSENLEEVLAVGRFISLVGLRLTRMLLAQKELNAGADDAAYQAMSEALDEVLKDWKNLP